MGFPPRMTKTDCFFEPMKTRALRALVGVGLSLDPEGRKKRVLMRPKIIRIEQHNEKE